MYKVVLADDEIWNLQGLERLIPWEEKGFTVALATTDPAAALDYIARENADLLITDVRMPVMNGIQLISKLREGGSDVECVILSGYADFEYARSAIHLQVDEYCLKPLKAADLSALLERVRKKVSGKRASIEPAAKKITKTAADVDNEQFRKMVEFINERFTDNLMLKDVAGKFYLNANYCCLLFKKHLRATFSEYVNNLRVEKAKDLLSGTNLTVGEVASQSGYNDYFYFNKIFKRIAGLTPKAYRAAARARGERSGGGGGGGGGDGGDEK